MASIKPPAVIDLGDGLINESDLYDDDFDIDDDLQIIERPAATKITASSQASVQNTTQPPSATPQKRTDDPDVEVLWSSSPYEHRFVTLSDPTRPAALLPSKPNIMKRPSDSSDSSSSGPASHDSTITSKPKRKLPWAEREAAATAKSKLKNSIELENSFSKPHSRVPSGDGEYLFMLDPKRKVSTAETSAAAGAAGGKSRVGRSRTLSVQEPVVKLKSAMSLSDEQKRVMEMVVKEKKSIFFTGSAGTGKSVLLREIIKELKQKPHGSDAVAVTASTGLAAVNIGGVTVHSFAGIGLGREEAKDLARKIRKNKKLFQRWLRTKVLIIDEVSMIDGRLFDKLETIARILRNSGRPFGGIQLVLTGDFFQLPPVPEKNVQVFAFQAESWRRAVNHTICLHKVFRQRDPEFASFLNRMRLGLLTKKDEIEFNKQQKNHTLPGDLEATELFSTRMEVDRSNSRRMAALTGPEVTYTALEGGLYVGEARDNALASCLAAKVIVLKKHAQVMLLKNMDEMLVNGSLGKVLAFVSEREYVRVLELRRHEEELRMEGGEYTLPGSQDLDRDLAALRGYEWEDQKSTGKEAQEMRWPLVRFTSMTGETRDVLITRESWKIEHSDGQVLASRDQIPLILAWALSIHKAQGQTIDRVKVDLSRVFEKGQAYVALSRATSRAGLEVRNFSIDKVQVHDTVTEFYRNLERLEASSSSSAANEADEETELMRAAARHY